VISTRSRTIGEKEARKTTRGHEEKREFEGEVIKNKRLLNLTHISLKKDK
jgi:hypothetical protein